MRTALLFLLPVFALSAGEFENSWESVRCGNALVSVGDSMETVRTKCGEPESERERTEEIFRCLSWKKEKGGGKERRVCSAYRKITIRFSDWTYNLGPTRFVRYFSFSDGVLYRIATGAYGSL